MPIDGPDPARPEIIKLGEGHVGRGVELSTAAGWNQTENDWRLLICAGQAIGIEDGQGSLIATALTLPQGKQFGWISMVLVDKAYQGRGFATRLLKSCLTTLENAHLVPVLDATSEGEPLYRSLGFEAQFAYQRWVWDGVCDVDMKFKALETLATKIGCASGASLPSAMPVVAQQINQIDQRVFGGQRPEVLQSLRERSVVFSAMTVLGDGFVLGREGTRAWQIGPISAALPTDAMALLVHALARIKGSVGKGKIYIDLCDTATQMIGFVDALGFAPQRRFVRMAKGAGVVFGSVQEMYALAGPELG